MAGLEAGASQDGQRFSEMCVSRWNCACGREAGGNLSKVMNEMSDAAVGETPTGFAGRVKLKIVSVPLSLMVVQ